MNKIKLNKKKVFAIILLIVMLFVAIGGIGMGISSLNQVKEEVKDNVVVENVIETDNKTVEEAINNVVENKTVSTTTKKKQEVLETRYTTTGVNIRKAASLKADILKTVPINTKVTITNNSVDKWSEIKIDNNYYYIYSIYLSKDKTIIKTTSRSNTQTRTTKTVYKTKSGKGVLTKSKGVNYYNGHRETWYSQKVLPGGGLRIPGRHVASDGTIRDKNNYICVASSDYKRGTIVQTSLGTGKVYDSGCASGTIDIYTNW